MEKTVLLAGGDRRQTWLARLLAEKCAVRTLAVPRCPDTVRPGPCDLLVLPCPCLDRNGMVRTAGEGLPLEGLLPFLGPETRIFGGALGRAAAELGPYCASVTDLLEDPAVTEENAALTAEAALMLTQQSLEAPVRGLCTAVLGWGRIGRRLGALLTAHGAAVTAAARREEARAEAGAASCAACAFSELPEDFDLVFNTVPARTLSDAQLRRLGSNCLWVELASAPGGLPDPPPEGLRVLPAGSLPGRILPRAAAEVLFAGILRTVRWME